jgi:hypothetical protein
MSSFKTIDKYYKSRGISWKTEWRQFSEGLYKHYSNNPEYKLIIETFILNNINSYLNEETKLKVKSFDLAI